MSLYAMRENKHNSKVKFFLASSHIWEGELKEAMKRMKEGKTHVIPFLVRDCTWEDWAILPGDATEEIKEDVKKRDFTKLQISPRKDGKPLPLDQWEHAGSAYKKLAKTIAELCDKS